jgi:hypothetical protein
MQTGVMARIAAGILLIASLAALALDLPGNSDIRLSGERLAAFARQHPPKPWRGFEAAVQEITVDSEVHIKARVTGNMIHTPVTVSGTPLYDAQARAMYFRVSKVELPHESGRPMLSKLNTLLTPLGASIAKHVTDVIPVKHLKTEKRGESVFIETVKSVRVENGAVVLEVHGFFLNIATGALMLVALASGLWLLGGLFRRPAATPQA